MQWKLKAPIQAIIFDCDGTLSQIEALDEAAKENGVGPQVQQLTEQAMAKTGLTPEIYKTRLEIVKPTLEQINGLSSKYYQNRTQDIQAVLNIFNHLNKKLYIVSAGFRNSIEGFAEQLDIPKRHIFAVDLKFDENNHYIDFDHHSPLIRNDGKGEIIKQLKQEYSSLLYVGDGLNDCIVINQVTRFVGFGGNFYRKNIADLSPFYILTQSMLPLLPLALTDTEVAKLKPEHQNDIQQGLNAINDNKVLMKSFDASLRL